MQVISATSVSALSPPDGTVAPPGYYMLFLVSVLGTPSVARFTYVPPDGGDPTPAPAPVPSPGVGTLASGQSLQEVTYLCMLQISEFDDFEWYIGWVRRQQLIMRSDMCLMNCARGPAAQISSQELSAMVVQNFEMPPCRANNYSQQTTQCSSLSNRMGILCCALLSPFCPSSLSQQHRQAEYRTVLAIHNASEVLLSTVGCDIYQAGSLTWDVTCEYAA